MQDKQLVMLDNGKAVEEKMANLYSLKRIQ